MPNTAPPSENATNSTDSSSIGRSPVALTSRIRPRSTAPLAWTSPNAPPTISTNAITPTAAALRLPDVSPSNSRFSRPTWPSPLANSCSGTRASA